MSNRRGTPSPLATGRTRAAIAPRLPRPGAERWDGVQTIFPVLVLEAGGVMDAERLRDLHLRLQGAADQRVKLGQPVVLGVRDGRPLSALRLCASARMVVEALTAPDGPQAVIERAVAAVDRVAAAARAS